MAETNKPPTALERHTRLLYDKLEELGEPDPEIEDTRIVETRMTHLFEELGIPVGYYSRIRSVLFDGIDPCVILIQRGSHGMPSVLAVRHPPTPEIFTQEGLTRRDSAGTVLLDAAGRVTELERWRDSLTPADESRLNVVEAIRNHEARLAKLEALLAEGTASTGETNGKTA